MDIESFREYCLSKHQATEGLPFGPDVLVFKVGEKMFGLLMLNGHCSANLKCDPERAVDLREQFHYIIPGIHMNKKHWNTILLNECTNFQFVHELIDHSYQLVFESLSKKMKEILLQKN